MVPGPIANIITWGLDGYKIATGGDNLIFEADDFVYVGCTCETWETSEQRRYKIAVRPFFRAESPMFRLKGKRLTPWIEASTLGEGVPSCACRVIDLRRREFFLGIAVFRATDRPTHVTGSGYTFVTMSVPSAEDGRVRLALAATYPRPDFVDPDELNLPSLDYKVQSD